MLSLWCSNGEDPEVIIYLFIYLFMKFVLGRKQETELTIGDRQRDTIECSSAFVMTTKEVGLKVQRL